MDLLDYFGKQIEYVQPDIVSMENVPKWSMKRYLIKFIRLNDNYLIDYKSGIRTRLWCSSKKKEITAFSFKIREQINPCTI